jgi:hypothetical protein
VVRAALIVLLLSSCSVLFDPAKVKCQQAPAVATGPLDGIAGDGTSLTFEWPAMPRDSGIGGYRVCIGADPNVTGPCRSLAPDRCDAGLCAVTFDGPDAGLKYNTRVFAKLFGLDACNDPSDPGAAPLVSLTPVNGNFLDKQGMTLLAACDAGVLVDGGGVLTLTEVDNVNSCISAIGVGDDLWRSSTLDVEVRTYGAALAGVAERVPVFNDPASQRVAVLLTPNTDSADAVAVSQRIPPGPDVAVATSVTTVPDGVWRALRVTAVDAGVSVSLGDVGMPPAEILRWTDPSPVAGSFGLALVGFGFGNVNVKADFRNLRIRTSATLPTGGPTSASWTFSGTTGLNGVRRSNATPMTCPTYPAATGCASASMCQPNPGSLCLELNPGFLRGSFASVDMPIGIDPAKPWHVKFKVGVPLAAAVADAAFLRTTTAPTDATGLNTFGGFALLDVHGDLATPLRAFQSDAVGTLSKEHWNLVELDVDPGHGMYTATLNGMSHAGGYPPLLGAHLGALELGGGGAFDAFYTDLEIAQP